ncbi:MAG TPA: NAD(P)-dependent oxidoreductase [Gemmatimonadales bacterium]|nr:NAD(P)-dependent oxidoreductase [Gemmatimonadales bacterium]
MHIGFLGLGALGAPIAGRLAAVHPTTVWNRTPARSEEFLRLHAATMAATPRDAASGADVVLTCLPTSAEVEKLLDGPDGLLAGLRPGALLLDCTSGDPAASRRIGRRLAEAQVAFADAPVSGGPPAAASGALTVMVGAEDAVFDRARPVLEAFGKRIEHVGPVGAGHALKSVNNALLAVNILALAEGLTALVKAGVPAGKAVEVINASSGRSFASEALVPERVLTGTWPRLFRLALLDKDVGIALGVLEGAGVQGPLLARVRDLTAQLRAELGEEADYLDPIRRAERRAGVEIRG